MDLSCAAAYTSNIFLCSRKDSLREESSVNMKIFIVFKDLHAELPGLTMPDVFGHLNDHIRTRFGTYENMTVLYVVSDWSFVSRFDNPVTLRVIVDFNMSNSKISQIRT